MKRPGPSRIHSGSGSTAADRVAACRVQMRRRSELAMPCPRAVGCFAVPAQPQSTYLGMFFVQSHHHRHRDQVMASHFECHLTVEPLLRCVGEASVRSVALVPGLWLVEVASRQPHQRHAASDIGTTISHADAFRARRLCAACSRARRRRLEHTSLSSSL